MKKGISLLIVISLLITSQLKSQQIRNNREGNRFELPHYPVGDFVKILYKNVSYPDETLQKRISGDVITSFVITVKGKMDSISVIRSADFYLSNSALTALSYIADGWIPAKLNDNPVNKKFKIVFRYRLYYDSAPPEYRKLAKEWFEKKNYKKSLGFCNKAIKDDQYDYETYDLRSQVNEILGNTESSIKDRESSVRLRDDVLSVITLSLIGKSRTVQISGDVVRMK